MDDASKKMFEHEEYLKKNPKKLLKDVYPTSFVPVRVKSALELKQKADEKIAAAKRKENIAKADEELMSTARDPVPIEAFKVLTGYNGVDEQLVAFVPTTPWSSTGVYFDGLKYTGPLS
jgi:hypothetical protein